jgi:hypothetical protein
MPLSPRKQPRPSTSTIVLEQTDHNDDISMPLIAKHYWIKVMKGLHDLRKAGVLCDYMLFADGVMAACSDYFQVMLTGI